MPLKPCSVVAVALAVVAGAHAEPPVSAGPFALSVGPHGLGSLKLVGDAFDTDYVSSGRNIGDIVLTVRKPGGAWRTVRTASLNPQFRQTSAAGDNPAWEASARDDALEIVTRFAIEGTGPTASLNWSIGLTNHDNTPLEIGDLAIAAPFNTDFGSNANSEETTSLEAHRRVLEERVIPHWQVAGHGSFVFLQRPNALGPFLVMVPTGATRLELYDHDEPSAATTQGRRQAERLFYVHSAAKAETLAKQLADWQTHAGNVKVAPTTRLGHTSVTLPPNGQANYGLKFRFTPDNPAGPYDGVRQVLYEEGKLDVTALPGMTVPSDLTATIAVRTKRPIDAVVPEFPDHTRVTEIPAPPTAPTGTRLFRVKFDKLGENLLTIRSGDQATPLEFFVTEPLETLIKKRAAFLVSHCQWTNTGKWFDGVFTEWDAVKKVLRSPDDRDGLFKYILTCDDPGLGKAPFLASKNAFLPDQGEIAALDDYITRFVWGKLQMTDTERHPYAIYGIDDWHVNRNSPDPGRNGRDHVWRIYDYPHIVLLYYRMYQIAEKYPAIKTALPADEYLTRAYRTAMAYFEVPTKVEGWSAYYTGTYNEIIIPDVIDALASAGRHDDAEKLRAHWEQKVKAFVFADDPYLYGSEYAYDSTTFEGSAALAKWAVERMAGPGYSAPPALPVANVRGKPEKPQAFPAVTAAAARAFLRRQLTQNISARGLVETNYYLYGSDLRGTFGGGYTLSYMSQMGGWGVFDYALHHADPAAAETASLLRLGYASQLSSFALINSGTAESDYGYWFPGKENDGAAGGGFEPRPFARSWIGKTVPRGSWPYACEIDLGFSGALRSAATIVTEDPLIGPTALGGELNVENGVYRVIPRDGLRQRLHIRLPDLRADLELSQDAFAADQPIDIDTKTGRITFQIENRSVLAHQTTLIFSGLTPPTVRVGDLAATVTPGVAGKFTAAIRLDDDAPRITVETRATR